MVDWSADEYAQSLSPRCTGQNMKVESRLLQEFPPLFTPTRLETEPCIIIDKDGRILLWYLPGILTKKRVVSVRRTPINDV